MKAATQAHGTGTAPLLYWLAVICGLGGITILRFDEPKTFIPLWFGSVVGIATGQLFAVLRVRIWALTSVGIMLSWFIIPVALFVLSLMFGMTNSIQDVLLALVPAAICGYASLSERGGLVAFWYPAMLWMLVILDGGAPGTFATRAALPLVVGLAVLFVAFLRARESRRAALWQAHATVRLAPTAQRLVLRASPLRGIGQLAWTGFIGAGTLLLAAWIAPKMWQKDREVHHHTPLAAATYDESGIPCCPDSEEQREKIREYMPLRGDQLVYYARESSCRTCRFHGPAEEKLETYASGPGAGLKTMSETWRPARASWEPGYYLSNGGYAGNGYDNNNSYSGYGTVPSYQGYTGSYTGYEPPAIYAAAPAATWTPPPVATWTPPAVTTVWTPPPTPKPILVSTSVGAKSAPPAVVKPPAVVTKAPDTGTPWGLLLPLLVSALLFPLASRLVRRQLTLRHLARPFWRETIDQRISNHWQRVLIALRDAGIYARTNEQPQAFAKRVGIAGMDVCATILERARHGVRVDADDLASMDAAATTIYRTTRARAGIAGQIAGSFRWPLV